MAGQGASGFRDHRRARVGKIPGPFRRNMVRVASALSAAAVLVKVDQFQGGGEPLPSNRFRLRELAQAVGPM
jgi:hypothetical protein